MLTGDYDLEIKKILAEIKKVNAKRILIQLPDGLKPYANILQEKIQNKFPNSELFFWAGSCYGACDSPIYIKNLDFDILIQLGHAPWRY